MTRDLALVIISLFAWGVGEGAFTFFQTLYMETLGATPLLIGAILSVWGLAMALTQLPAGYLTDRLGPRPLMWFSWIMGTVAAALMAAARNLQGFVIGLVIYGLTSSVLAPMNTYITAARGTWTPARALSVASASFTLGAALGPMVGGFIAQTWGLRQIYVFGFFTFGLSTLLVLFIRCIAPTSSAPLPRLTLPTTRPFLNLLAFNGLGIIALYLAQPLTPNYLTSYHGITMEQIGLFGSLCSLGTTTLALAFGHLKPTSGMILGLVTSMSFALITWLSHSLWGFGVGYFLLGGFRFYRSMILAWARSLVGSHQVGSAYGLIETVNALGIVISAALAGWLYQRSPSLVYLATLLLGALALGISQRFSAGESLHPGPALVPGRGED
ncbi:MFS transporter [uncultured Thermanaerothrix sp.]|uniref:MFS transporter n=1 Tax=uncultured Thermanaerothrix sp. TaxID=1195149 RepID=UPI002602D1EA|nr:MFS transporter [uncultured Thermanaerothrix sp.]